MKTLCLNIMVVVWLVCPSLGWAVDGDDILGEWVTEGGGSRVEIFKKDHRYFGKIVALKKTNYLPGEETGLDGTPRLDLQNSNESLRSRPLVGVELMKNFRFEKEKWVGGRIYDPENGRAYKCKISLTKDGTLHVRGYIGVSLLGRTTVWESARAYLEKELAFLGLVNCACQ
jgi:uncharacterized protein (DUF2147 family)